MIDRRERTLRKLGAICSRIEDKLAGQDVSLADVPLPQEAEPGETPVERLQRFKALLNKTLEAMDAGLHPRCEVCEAPLLDTVLDEMPWATTCQECGVQQEAQGPCDRGKS